MDLGLDGARALVTGGSAGLGAATARELAREGVRVAVAARSSKRLEEVVREVNGVAVEADLTTADGPAHAVQRAMDQLGGLDLLLVNMGGPPGGKFMDLDDETWQRALDMTFWSSVHLLRAALPALSASDRGAVCVILSSSVREPIPALTTSNLLRPGLVGLIKSLVPEIAPVRINGIAPGRVTTDRTAAIDEQRAQRAGITIEAERQKTIDRVPLHRYGEPADVGRVAAFLLSPAAAYVNGQIVAVDGGMIRSIP
jgi:3-oxoacyl-[acyl-carrier protein] reductase